MGWTGYPSAYASYGAAECGGLRTGRIYAKFGIVLRRTTRVVGNGTPASGGRVGTAEPSGMVEMEKRKEKCANAYSSTAGMEK